MPVVSWLLAGLGLQCNSNSWSAMLLGEDPCLSHPCQNSGTCVNEGGLTKCYCVTGFTGEHCETGICCNAKGLHFLTPTDIILTGTDLSSLKQIY